MKDIISYLLGTIDDISDDISDDASEVRSQNGGYGGRDEGGGYAIMKLLTPHFIGALVGLAFAGIFKPGFSGYAVSAVFFAFLGGVYKSVSFDKIAFRHAIARNLIIMFFLTIFIFIASLCGSGR